MLAIVNSKVLILLRAKDENSLSLYCSLSLILLSLLLSTLIYNIDLGKVKHGLERNFGKLVSKIHDNVCVLHVPIPSTKKNYL